MNKKVGVVSALALVAAKVGVATTAFGAAATGVAEQCVIYSQMEDRGALQDELAKLLANDPDSVCIDVIVGILGGSPIAQVPVQQVY